MSEQLDLNNSMGAEKNETEKISLESFIAANKRLKILNNKITDEELRKFVSEHKGVWFKDVDTPLFKYENEKIVSDVIYYIDADLNFFEVEIDFTQVDIKWDNLEEELNKIGFKKLDEGDHQFAVRLQREAAIHYNEDLTANLDEAKEEDRQRTFSH